MAANAGAKIFREFFRESPCRMAYLLKPLEGSAQRPLSSKIVERPKTAPNLLLNRSTVSSIQKAPAQDRPVTRFDRRDGPIPPRSPSATKESPSPKSKKKQTVDSRATRKDPSKKHRTSTGAKVLNAVEKRDPPPRKPGRCKVCLPDDPTGFLLNEIDHIRERILDRPESISCRQAIALAQHIRNRVDAIVLPAGSAGERDTRIKFIGGRVESFGRMPDLKRKASVDVAAVRSAKREKTILDKKVTSSPLGGWMRHVEEQKNLQHQR